MSPKITQNRFAVNINVAYLEYRKLVNYCVILHFHFTVEPFLLITYLQWPGFFVPTVHRLIHLTVIEISSLQLPTVHNLQLILPQGGRCTDVKLFLQTHLNATAFLIRYKPYSIISKVHLVTCDPLVGILSSLCSNLCY